MWNQSTVSLLRPAFPDERLHQGAEGPAPQQRGRPPQRSQVKLQCCSFLSSRVPYFFFRALGRLRSGGRGELPRALRPPPTFGMSRVQQTASGVDSSRSHQGLVSPPLREGGITCDTVSSSFLSLVPALGSQLLRLT